MLQYGWPVLFAPDIDSCCDGAREPRGSTTRCRARLELFRKARLNQRLHADVNRKQDARYCWKLPARHALDFNEHREHRKSTRDDRESKRGYARNDAGADDKQREQHWLGHSPPQSIASYSHGEDTDFVTTEIGPMPDQATSSCEIHFVQVIHERVRLGDAHDQTCGRAVPRRLQSCENRDWE